MFNSLYVLLALLFTKHWYIDFVNQTPEEVAGKGIYGNAHVLMHSIKHGVATMLIMYVFVYEPLVAIVVGFIDFVLHYHIDWAKMNINKRWNYTIDKPAFWAWLGADQLAHSFTYLWLVWLLF
jgi:hypothetical protein